VDGLGRRSSRPLHVVYIHLCSFGLISDHISSFSLTRVALYKEVDHPGRIGQRNAPKPPSRIWTIHRVRTNKIPPDTFIIDAVTRKMTWAHYFYLAKITKVASADTGTSSRSHALTVLAAGERLLQLFLRAKFVTRTGRAARRRQGRRVIDFGW